MDDPAPITRITRSDYASLTEDEQRRYDKARRVHNARACIVNIPSYAEIHNAIRDRLDANDFSHQPVPTRGIAISGPPTTGKSTLMQNFGKLYELELREDFPERFGSEGHDFTPVAYISVPAGATPKQLSQAFAHFYGIEVWNGITETQLTRMVLQTMKHCETSLLLLDDITALRLSHKDGQLALEHLKTLMNGCRATIVMAGVDLEDTPLFSKRGGFNAQIGGRFTIYDNKLFEITTREEQLVWRGIVQVLERHHCLLDHPKGSLTKDHWRYLWQRSGGSISTLTTLLRDGASKAQRSGVEALTVELLETIRTDAITQAAYDKIATAEKRRIARTAAKQLEVLEGTGDNEGQARSEAS